MSTVAWTLGLSVAVSSSLMAQRSAPVVAPVGFMRETDAARHPAAPVPGVAESERRPLREPPRGSAALPLRLLTGAAGAVTGALGGLIFADTHLHGDCGGSDPNWCVVLAGAAVGAAIGGGIGAALPRGKSRCSFTQRAGPALLGASAGSLLGYALGRTGSGLVFTVPIGAAVGGAVLAERC